MAYSSDMAKLLAQQLNRLVTLKKHQLAGHFANLDFWLDEVKHCQAVIDGYRARFEHLRHHDPRIPRVPDREIESTRHELREAAYRFLIRCHHEGLLDEAALRQAADQLDIGVDLADVRR